MYRISIIYAVLLSIVFSIPVLSQTIELDLPSCYYLQYHLAIKQGTKLDTIAVGRFDETGKARFSVPEKYINYRGTANISVLTTGKNWNIILNKEAKIILREIANTNNIVFSESKENMALQDFIEGRKVANNELLYAARIFEILSCLSAEQVGKNQRIFISEKLDFKDLYHSGFWDMTLKLWYQLNSVDDTLLLNESRKILDRTIDIPTRRELTQEVIRLFSRYGKDNLLMELGSEYLTIPINGKPAPELVTDGEPIQPKSCLIIFYDSDCGLCHNELHQMKEKYSFINNDHNQIDVISVSADTNKDVFEDTIQKFPWQNKLCDYKGFAGENFENYGIAGTPTIILVDKEGIVRGRYARLSEFLKY